MPSIIEQLQRDALDPSIPVSTLLRRVKLAAVKLGLGAVEDWVEQELNGYTSTPPDYRIATGSPMMQNPLRGWIPIGGHIEKLAKRPTYQPAAQLEALLLTKGDTFQMPYPDKVSAHLNEMNGVRGWPCALEIDRSQLAGTLDRVRTLILDWALNLEKAGIIGTEVGFDSDEKEKAKSVGMTINIGSIGTFTGNLGDGNVARDINSSVDQSAVAALLEQLKPKLEELSQAGADKIVLAERIAAIEAEMQKPPTDRKAIRGLLTDLRNALVGAAGNLIASGAISVVNQILGAGVPPPP